MDTIDLQVNSCLQRLIKARKQAGLSQSQVAKLLGYDSHASIVAMERGERKLTVERMYRLAKIYNVDRVWLITGENPNFDRGAFNKIRTKAQEMSHQHKEDLNNLEGLLESLSQYPTKEK